MEKNQLINLSQSDSQMHLIYLPPKDQLDLEKIVDGHHTIFHVEKKALFIGLAWVLPIEKKNPSFSRRYLC